MLEVSRLAVIAQVRMSSLPPRSATILGNAGEMIVLDAIAANIPMIRPEIAKMTPRWLLGGAASAATDVLID
ncbi:hypothetical protein GCM10011575_47550 [Microlunatus endophyticus]|uniref:Uncharacterized protein n=1 Tax=Microlunatus endophyticus TaxID=1716077 RepID=A0A917WA93_9ACTN|nr:hypothetical protein GCM10011575_47550 [Microlunatus endophyticus]